MNSWQSETCSSTSEFSRLCTSGLPLAPRHQQLRMQPPLSPCDSCSLVFSHTDPSALHGTILPCSTGHRHILLLFISFALPTLHLPAPSLLPQRVTPSPCLAQLLLEVFTLPLTLLYITDATVAFYICLCDFPNFSHCTLTSP